jgi:UDP-N-acetylglucosamine--N-acetylmuramyl-(pentapeptide) pyrophosphoryl-undecaprenol N-acetylglucosamine transferase
MDIKVILAAGGSGGHIFPSVALATELEKAGVREISFISSKRTLDRNLLKGTRHRCFFLSVNPMPLRFHPVRYLVFFWKLFVDALVSVYLMIRLKPDVVVGFGGYSSGTIAAVAKAFRVPVLIHEQNLVPGRANKMLSRVADRIAVSFRDSLKYFPGAEGKVVYSGNPLRTDMLLNDRGASADRIGISPEKKTILVMGGSQGSSFLNGTASEAAKRINMKMGDTVQFIHLTGRKDFDRVREFYRTNGIAGKVFSFLERIDDAYAASDIAISRAGAAAVFELAYYSKPMILVPYPSVKNNQRFNAEFFSKAGAAICREEKDLVPDSLALEIMRILNDAGSRGRMSKAAGMLSEPGAGRKLAEEVIKLAL